MAIVTLPYTFANGEGISGTKIQDDFDAIVDGVNDYFGNTVITSLPYSFADGGILYSANVMANLTQIIKQTNVLALDEPIINAMPFSFTGFTLLDAVQFQTNLDSIVGDINAISDSAASFLAVNNSPEAVSRSPNGFTWRLVDFPITVGTAVTWSGTIYCALGIDDSGNSQSAVSYDGVTWHVHAIPNGAWNKVVWSGVNFCAVDSVDNVVITSPDGIVWTAYALPASHDFANDISWNGTVFCVVTPDSGSGSSCSTSPTGAVWTPRAGFPNDADGFVAISWNGTVFCVICGSKNITSPTGTVWTDQVGFPLVALSSITTNGDDFLCLSQALPFAAVSADNGVTWNTYAMPDTLNWSVPTWNGYVYCTLVYNGSVPSNKGAVSATGQTWIPVTLPYTSLPAAMVSAHLTFGTF